MKVEMVAPLIGFNWTLAMVMVTVLVLYLILRKFFFQKLRDFMQARAQKIQDSFDDADKANEIAEKKLQEYNEKLDGIEAERREVLKETKLAADARAAAIVEEANKKAGDIILRARKEIEREREQATQNMSEQIGALAIFAAEKIIEQKLSETDQRELIDKVIKQVSKK